MPASPGEARAPSTDHNGVVSRGHAAHGTTTPPRRRHAGGGGGVGGGVRRGLVDGGGGSRQAQDDAADGPTGARPPRAGPGAVVVVAARRVQHRGPGPRALVVNLDRVRAVVTAHEVLVPCPRDPAVAPLVRELRARLTTKTIAADDSPSLPQVLLRPLVLYSRAGFVSLGCFRGAFPEDEVGGAKERRASSGSDKVLLPFEFRALEVCLDFACKSLEHEVRDELEHLLDDDMDMAAMHLTEKLAYKAAGHSSRFDAQDETSEFYEERYEMLFNPMLTSSVVDRVRT
ncbi:hypothetical protein PR202_gb15649 [Eleusine coracana subsp. coracana]|uniref:Uncharacterized protein n=1 Tax=Eleusine coracana subsp. coracana TaxID=191504 RepID=A0AAV5EYE5_ELECO|nr:hypothetical protein PR202_gb15649 [Eleusine coracana subsp. coracana]